MRLLAERLHTSTATLYRHVTGKDELMVYVVDRLLADIQVPGARDKRPRDWQDAARQGGLRFYRVLAEHPNVLPLLVSQVPIGPNALAVRERTLATLAQFGFSPRLAARAYTAIAQYTLGVAVVQSSSAGSDEVAALGDYYRALGPEAYPHTAAAANALTDVSPEPEFLEGLQFVLDGIDRARRRQ